MGKKTLNLSGKPGTEYDLEEMKQGVRSNKEKPLIIQVHEYEDKKDANPKNLRVGQIWLSKKKQGK